MSVVECKVLPKNRREKEMAREKWRGREGGEHNKSLDDVAIAACGCHLFNRKILQA